MPAFTACLQPLLKHPPNPLPKLTSSSLKHLQLLITTPLVIAFLNLLEDINVANN